MPAMGRFARTHVDDLALGMFVSDLDRPWMDSPFLLQGFTINTLDEIATLRELCTYVDIDIGLSQTLTDVDLTASHGGIKRAKVVSKVFPDKTLITYEDVFTFEGELGSAEKVFNDYEKMIGKMYQGIAVNGRVDMELVSATINNVVDSIMRNPDACMLLTAIRGKDSYSYSHAMASSILAAAMGRQIGLPLQDIKTLATGSVLCDVGKLRISSRILNKSSPLSERERSIVKDHVSEGIEILKKSAGVSEEVLSIVANHHERHNGEGYPNGHAGNQIEPFARIAGIVDCYDAMVSDRAYARGVSPADAISKLYTMRNVDFQSELVEEFIQTVGIYPVGSLVELTDGRVGIVVTEHRRRRLRPRILLILDGENNQLPPGSYINLLDNDEDEMGRPLGILKGADPGDYGISLDDLCF
jgi:putative nucleotidyltransferase with HDIG domain